MTGTLTKKQQEIVRLHQLSPTFNLDEALAAAAPKPRGRPPKVTTVEVKEDPEVPFREGRFLLEHLENRHVPFVRKQCMACGRDFLGSYKSVAFCDDICRANHFHEKYGFTWNPERSEAERWELWKEPPSVVKPETLRRLEAFARAILGIEPTKEDLDLPAPEFEKPNVLSNKAIGNESATGQNSTNGDSVLPGSQPKARKEKGISSHNDNGGISSSSPSQLSAVQAENVAAIKAKFRAGEITAHELQEQLTAAFRA